MFSLEMTTYSMIHLWRRLFASRNIQSRILARGMSLTIVPLTLVLCVVWAANGLANSIAVDGCFRLASQDLNHTVLGLLGACRLYHGDISASLDGAKVVMDRAGAVTFDPSLEVTWQAKNQFTSQISTVRLPTMKIGSTPIRPIADFGHEAPIVDEVQSLYRTTATVFQRINQAGDMLRIATSVKKLDGNRAIGTYIPAIEPDGKPNAVVSTVLQGKTYQGRAFVVNSWYMTAYQPIKDGSGKVVGVIYTGLPESQLRDQMIRFKDYWAAAGKTDVFVIHTAAKVQGLFVLSSDKSLQDHVAWNYRDAKGQLYVQDICRKALANSGKISETVYSTLPVAGKPSQLMLARYLYFPEWDWVIGVQTPESSFFATPLQIGNIFRISNFVPLGLVVLASIASFAIWKRLTVRMSGEVGHVMQRLQESSRQFAQAIQSISGHAENTGRTAEELCKSTTVQVHTAEHTAAATSSVTETALENSDAAERMRALATNSEVIVGEAKKTLADVSTAMQSIVGTNDQALSIIDTINEISFATNIVALNASVEAAKAGEAGRTFSFIADEVRQLSAKVAAAASETRAVINNARSEMDRGSEHVRKLVLALGPMDQNADQVRRLAVAVSTTSQSQAQSIAEVLKAVENIQKSSHSTAASAQQGTQSAADLRSQVAALAASVSVVDQAVRQLNEEFLSDS